MKTVTAIRHIHFEDLGILEPLLTDLGFNLNYVDAPTANFTALNPIEDDLVIVLGAPIGAFDEHHYPFITNELAYIQERLNADKPILGICLGAQFIARLLGAEVKSMGHKEIGFSPLTLTDVPNNPLAALAHVPVLHWHGDAFAIPDGLQSLASTNLCATQAFQTDTCLALQFHLEANPQHIEHWLVGHASELSHANIDIAKIRNDAQTYGSLLTKAGKETITNWLSKLELIHDI